MSTISLEAAVRTCKVNTGWANRIQSDRFENSNLMMCPVWNERDLTGRKVCSDSFYTKREGCNSALDRINVENDQRPQYAEYITLDTAGYRASSMVADDQKPGVETYIHPSQHKENYVMGAEKTMAEQDATLAYSALDNVYNITGHWGYNNTFRDTIEPTCTIYPYEYAMASMAQSQRYAQGLAQGAQNQANRSNM